MKPPNFLVRASLARVAVVFLAAACSSTSVPVTDANVTAPTFCGRGVDVPGATPPPGFCLKQYAKVVEARTITFAPNGDLFVGAPSSPTPGGSSGGPGAILLLTDANKDGVAETHTFLAQIDANTSLEDVHGLAVGGGSLYFTTQASVWSTPYTDGQLVASATPVSLGLTSTFGQGGRWTHGLARSVGGSLLASRGVFAMCGSDGGEISSVAANGTLTTLASGFRNPMYMRCHRTDEVCAAMELGEDLLMGAREKMLIVRPNTNYGYPCCTTMGAVAPPNTMGNLCTDVVKEDASFPLSDTPFGFDWETGTWPAPYTGGIFVALHGSAYSTPPWKGEGIVYAPANPTTHVPTQDWQMFLDGFSANGTVLERPSDIAFSPDGRMFFSDDQGGHVFWMAPTNLAVPAAAQ